MNVSPSTEHSPAPRDHWVTALLIFALGAITGLVGDACHITSKTSEYASAHVSMIGCSAVWFPGLVGAFVVVLAWSGRALGLPRSRRTGSDVFTGSAAVLALYALTATMRGQTSTVSVALCASLAVLIWRFWDRSLAALGLAVSAAVFGPLTEIGGVASGVIRYAPDSRALFGVALWLPCLYFAAGAVMSGLWRAIAREPLSD